MIKTTYWSNTKGTIAVKYDKYKVNFVRYGDDFVVTGDSQDCLIENLNLILRGWANYHSSMCSNKAFNDVYRTSEKNLRKWSKRRHPHKSTFWMSKCYWSLLYGINTFSIKKSILYPIHLTPILRHTASWTKDTLYSEKQTAHG
ncbi:group II intron maturase-specific domain-containing protein [Candidatus Enterococcus ferrettii]|uniref:group II intron maturase-specific domain-containing protein n=1 Tax=Candidatus Enterococcus ferrettii TaxID=2815324 RepID=UPI003D2FF063